MTLNIHPASPLPCPPLARSVRPDPELFGAFLLEAVTPTGAPEMPELPAWELRLWPVARLGDVTIEARPLLPHLGPDDLRAALRHGGWTPLGPVRVRRG
ncbi:hypothetical protein [Deinococcus aerophilus]|uniref:Uncharacterized protein n=1 Tax=Deinococcus aerophilus TaxID=522488 RepID=A0ABQ2GLP5_9DEIO|nr:hypothetical protein [Deinococcus aerophilus]GGM01509.1 hypothetical protein GCM10010841_07530 [Deinococcus aerophilus]